MEFAHLARSHFWVSTPLTSFAPCVMDKTSEQTEQKQIEEIPESQKSASWRFWLDIVLDMIIIASVVFLVRTFIISPFQVYGSSMCDTLNYIDNECQKGYGEYIIINKFGYQNFFGWQVGLPQRGDIIVFHPPHNQEEYFIKRVIGLPGETVKLKDGDVYIYNNEHPEGFELEESYLNSENKGNTLPTAGISTFEVPADHYFVMGDNRKGSSDSRRCFEEGRVMNEPCGKGENTPFLPRQNIEGKAWLVLWPLSKLEALANPF